MRSCGPQSNMVVSSTARFVEPTSSGPKETPDSQTGVGGPYTCKEKLGTDRGRKPIHQQGSRQWFAQWRPWSMLMLLAKLTSLHLQWRL